jgi:hypothetical protein
LLRDASGAPVSSLQLLAVRALADDREIWLGGLRRIVTPEPLRRHGYGSALLRATCALLRREHVAGAYLFSDFESACFRQLGFESVEVPVVETLLESLPSERGSSVRPMLPSDAAAVTGLHRRAAAGASFWFLRDEDQWEVVRELAVERLALRSGAEARALDLVLEEGSEILGYLLALTSGEACHLLEFGLARREGAWLERLLAGLRREAAARGAVHLLASWPPGPWGDLAAAFLSPLPQREGFWRIASLDPRFVPARIGREGRGLWSTDRI